MTPAKRGSPTPATEEPTPPAASQSPVAAPVAAPATKRARRPARPATTHIPQVAPATDAAGPSVPVPATGPEPAAAPAPRRSSVVHPERIWPD